jgi:hypothetical protein
MMNPNITDALGLVERIASVPNLPPEVSEAAGQLFVALGALERSMPEPTEAEWVSPFIDALREQLGCVGTAAPAQLRALVRERDELRQRVQTLTDVGRRILRERDEARETIARVATVALPGWHEVERT